MPRVQHHNNVRRILKLPSCDLHDSIDEMVDLHRMKSEQCMNRWREEIDDSGYMISRPFLRRMKVRLANGETSTGDIVVQRWKLKAYAEGDIAALWRALSRKYDPTKETTLIACLNRAYEKAEIENFVCKGTEHNFFPEKKKKQWWQVMLCI